MTIEQEEADLICILIGSLWHQGQEKKRHRGRGETSEEARSPGWSWWLDLGGRGGGEEGSDLFCLGGGASSFPQGRTMEEGEGEEDMRGVGAGAEGGASSSFLPA